MLATVEEKGTDGQHTIYSAYIRNLDMEELYVNISGKYQVQNLKTALAAIDVLRYQGTFTIEDYDIVNGLADIKKSTYFIGRWQQIGTHPMILCDSAHNKDGIKIVFEQVQNLDYRHLHIVFGMVNDKDPKQILSLLPSSALYYFAKAQIPRGLNADILHQEAVACGLKGKSYDSVKDALEAAKKNLKFLNFVV